MEYLNNEIQGKSYLCTNIKIAPKYVLNKYVKHVREKKKKM